MKIYVAGAYTNADPAVVAENVRLADEAAREIAVRGHIPFCPHTMTYGWERDDRLTYEDFLRIDLAWLARCDAVLLLPNWKHSMGTQRELTYAHMNHLHVFTRIEDIPRDG